MHTLIEVLVSLLAGFLIGILWGRRNTRKVETALADLKAEYDKLKQKVTPS